MIKIRSKQHAWITKQAITVYYEAWNKSAEDLIVRVRIANSLLHLEILSSGVA